MNVQDFINKWRRVELTERSASQQHFLDLCEVFEHPKPAEADASGEWFTFERGALKQGGGRGWADVWKRGFFGWEYKGKHRNLSAAYDQLLRYRESLENPPLLVTCDMERVVVHTNFTATVNRTHEVRLEEMGEPHNLEVLRAVFHSPERLRPEATVAGVTRDVAERLGGLAKGLRGRGFEPTAVARFLDRIVFCLFAEDVGLLPEGLFTQVAERSRTPESFSRNVALLFDAMREGGEFFFEPIRHFNGSLFTESPVLPLTSEEIETVKAAARLDWGVVDPSIFGTLFERGLDPDTRAQLGAQYTSREDIETLIEPVVMRPLRREWEEARAEIEGLLAKDTAQSHRRAQVRLRAFHERLSGVRVLDPACGSGNFLYVALQRLKDLEKQALVYGADRGLGSLLPQVNPTQFYGIEVNPYAFDLAQTTLWIGYLQWIHHNGYGTPPEPILRPMTSFLNADAVLDLSDPSDPREPEWPAVDFIVGNPPFLGDKIMRRELGDEYVDKLRAFYSSRIPGQSDLVCYWFEKARKQIEEGKAKRAGFLATQGIRGGANREVLKRIKQTGDIFFAVSDHDWVLDGANVHVSLVGFDDGAEPLKTLNGQPVDVINANLSSAADTARAERLAENSGLSFVGVAQKAPFDIDEKTALEMLRSPNPHGLPTSDVLLPVFNAIDITRRPRGVWNIDFGLDMKLLDAAKYEKPFEHVQRVVYPLRVAHREARQQKYWWLFARPCPDMRAALNGLPRYIATPRVSKFRLFAWLTPEILCDSADVVFARSDDYFFGVLHSRLHEVWSLAQGTQLREKESGFRYTPTTCFETFPFPSPSDEQREAIAEAARELDALRSRWLDPPEWTRREVLEFPGSTNGPWARYVTDADSSGVGVVRYPRPVPRDATAARELSRRTLTNLYNQRPGWLEHAHRRLDEAVSAAYGFPHALADEETLARLLSLNLERSHGAKQ
jgi:type II restriction/modification system DNA methylase subunit YeeA